MYADHNLISSDQILFTYLYTPPYKYLRVCTQNRRRGTFCLGSAYDYGVFHLHFVPDQPNIWSQTGLFLISETSEAISSRKIMCYLERGQEFSLDNTKGPYSQTILGFMYPVIQPKIVCGREFLLYYLVYRYRYSWSDCVV